MAKEKQKQAGAGTQEEELLGLTELEDIMGDMEGALGSLMIINASMTKLSNSDDFAGIEDTSTRFALYRLTELTDETLEKLEKAHDTLFEGIYKHKPGETSAAQPQA